MPLPLIGVALSTAGRFLVTKVIGKIFSNITKKSVTRVAARKLAKKTVKDSLVKKAVKGAAIYKVGQASGKLTKQEAAKNLGFLGSIGSVFPSIKENKLEPDKKDKKTDLEKLADDRLDSITPDELKVDLKSNRFNEILREHGINPDDLKASNIKNIDKSKSFNGDEYVENYQKELKDSIDFNTKLQAVSLRISEDMNKVIGGISGIVTASAIKSKETYESVANLPNYVGKLWNTLRSKTEESADLLTKAMGIASAGLIAVGFAKAIESAFDDLSLNVRNKFANIYYELIEKPLGWISDQWDDVKRVIYGFADDITESISNAWDSTSSYISELFNGISGTVTELATQISSAAEKLWNTVSEEFNKGIDTVKNFFSEAWNNFLNSDVVKGITEKWNEFAKSISDKWNKFLESDLGKLLTELTDDITDKVNEGIDWVKNTELYKDVKEGINKVSDKAKEVYTSGVDLVNDVSDSFRVTAEETYDKVVDTAKNILSEASNMYEKAKDEVNKALDKLVENTPDIVKDFGQGVADIFARPGPDVGDFKGIKVSIDPNSVSNSALEFVQKYESSGRADAIATDTGGIASYGKYQLYANGELGNFMDFLKVTSPETYNYLSQYDDYKNPKGKFASAWVEIYRKSPKEFTDLQDAFANTLLKRYLSNVPGEMRDFISSNPALVAMTAAIANTSIPAMRGLYKDAYRPGISPEEFINRVYELRPRTVQKWKNSHSAKDWQNLMTNYARQRAELLAMAKKQSSIKPELNSSNASGSIEPVNNMPIASMEPNPEVNKDKSSSPTASNTPSKSTNVSNQTVNVEFNTNQNFSQERSTTRSELDGTLLNGPSI